MNQFVKIVKLTIATLCLGVVLGAPFVAVASKSHSNAAGYGVDIEAYNAVEVSMTGSVRISN